MAYNVGGMLAQAGQTIGQQIGAPIREIGTGIGGMLAGRQQKQREQEAAKESQRLLQQYANNPAQLNALGQKYATEGNDALSKVFFEAAKQAQQIYDKQVARTDSRVADAKKRRDALIAGREATDEAFGEAVNMRRALVDAKRRSEAADATDKDKKLYELLKTRAITPSEYAKELLKEDKKGSEAKGYKVEDEILINGKKQSVVEFFDAEGNFLNRKVIGEVAPEEGEEGKDKPFMETKAGSDLYNAAVAENNTVTAEIQKFDSIITQSEKLAEKYDIPVVGGALGSIRDFAVSDIAGLGDEITAFRTSLNEIQMQKALALLPKGPASDRDVQLALNASPDLKNYTEEERLAALRGMKKILEARKQYIEGKVRWMEVTNDPNAVGYERYAEIKGFDRNIEDLKTKFPATINELNSIISEASKAKAAGDGVTYEALIKEAEALDANLVVGKDRFGNDIKGLGYVDTLKNRGNSRKLLDRTLENKGLTFEDINYV
jgi:hypothetical protein